MTETYYKTAKVIKKKYGDFYGFSLKEKIISLTLVAGASMLIISFVFFENQLVRNILFLLSGIFLINYFRFVFKKRKHTDEKDPFKLIDEMYGELTKKEIDNIYIVDGILKEVDEDLGIMETEKSTLYSRVSIIFSFIFWLPFCFLTRYYFENFIKELKWEDYLTLSGFLFQIAMYLIAIILMIGDSFDLFVTYGKREKLMVKRYLKDIKYRHYIK